MCVCVSVFCLLQGQILKGCVIKLMRSGKVDTKSWLEALYQALRLDGSWMGKHPFALNKGDFCLNISFLRKADIFHINFISENSIFW